MPMPARINYCLLMVPIFFLYTANVALAQDDSTAASNMANSAETGIPQAKQGLDLTLGGGIAYRPTYEGSDHYMLSPVPYVHITYNDMITFDDKALNAYWHQDNLRIGAGITYSGGRRDTKGNGIFSEGDDRLSGMGDINPALGMRVFASYDFQPVILGASITKFTGGDNSGVLTDASLSAPLKMMEQLILTPHIKVTWANQSYMQTFFGISDAQAASSGFQQFNAGSGLKDVSAGINARYMLDRHWFISGGAGVKQLTGDAASSPITFSSTEIIGMAMLGYHF